MDVVHEDLIAIFFRPGAAQVNHRAGVRMAAARLIGPLVARVRRAAQVVQVVGDRLDVVVRVRVEVCGPACR